MDARDAVYMLNPSGDLPHTQDTFLGFFQQQPGWQVIKQPARLHYRLCCRQPYLTSPKFCRTLAAITTSTHQQARLTVTDCCELKLPGVLGFHEIVSGRAKV